MAKSAIRKTQGVTTVPCSRRESVEAHRSAARSESVRSYLPHSFHYGLILSLPLPSYLTRYTFDAHIASQTDDQTPARSLAWAEMPLRCRATWLLWNAHGMMLEGMILECPSLRSGLLFLIAVQVVLVSTILLPFGNILPPPLTACLLLSYTCALSICSGVEPFSRSFQLSA